MNPKNLPPHSAPVFRHPRGNAHVVECLRFALKLYQDGRAIQLDRSAHYRSQLLFSLAVEADRAAQAFRELAVSTAADLRDAIEHSESSRDKSENEAVPPMSGLLR